ncbi:hypothetical protein EVAR_37518_1 [Eumeta japonica]|uniref:Helitron helicase-like domain-containing protein n=1 Tax=Eumeta variegata TaxID=151549 RepID=A0A4C1XC10_EUMVA|nr:hypothetical protein EVAR_37518_1 [Eumeta japonica]
MYQICLSQLNSDTALLSDEFTSVIETFIRSKRGKKRRKRFSNTIRTKQLREAASKCTKSHREVHREASRKYDENHPEIVKQVVRKYKQTHSEIVKNAEKVYKVKNPDVNRAATARYHEKRPKNKLMPWTSKHLSGLNYDSKINYSNDKIVNLGPRIPCSWCHALKWKDETQGMCCSSGKVQLPKLGSYPEPLHSLLTHQDQLSEHFLKNARKCNECFQMISFGAKEVREGNFMPTFKVQGQVYHRIGSLMSEANQKPSFLQIYFVGDEHQEK